jgi:hypothetical protein
MLMVGTDPLEVDRLLRKGDFRCPGCEGELRPWGHARSRGVRDESATVRCRPQRSACSVCPQTHVLLPAFGLARRADSAAVIGTGLLASANGMGHRKIAVMLGRPVSTVRGWLRRFACRAAHWRLMFTTLLLALDAMSAPITATGSAFGDALQALGLAAAAATRRFGPRPPWQFASSASRGLLLGPAPGAAVAAASVWLPVVVAG